MNFCRYGLAGCGKRCCFLCQSKCKMACNLKCKTLIEKEQVQAGGHNVIIHYAKKNLMPDPKWREVTGRVLVTSRGKGPRNVQVETAKGIVVVPRLNVRFLKDGAAGLRTGADCKH